MKTQSTGHSRWAWLCAGALGLLLLGAAPAGAQDTGPSRGAATGSAEENVTYKAKTVYDFEDDLVEGDLQAPDGELINSIGNVKHDSLIEIRKDFIPEMLKSLEDI